ncbi:unnamed protein product, partial [Cylindrotheca closterium]
MKATINSRATLDRTAYSLSKCFDFAPLIIIFTVGKSAPFRNQLLLQVDYSCLLRIRRNLTPIRRFDAHSFEDFSPMLE